MSGPAAEYMSKIARGEEKNEVLSVAYACFVTEPCGGGAEPRSHTPNEMT
jgi:hypothetical protein